MKIMEKGQAIELRKQGSSIQDIAKILNVSKSSVSVWVRDIELDEKQKELLKNKSINGCLETAHKLMISARAKRLEYQMQGRLKAREKDGLHMAGCMLYWAEGTKHKNVLSFCNSDASMLCFYKTFLDTCFNLKTSEYVVRCRCYTDHHSVEDIESYWLNLFKLPQSCLRKSCVNKHENDRNSKNMRHGLLEYGVCVVNVYSTKLVQHVYGAIQEYAGIENKKWLA